MACGLPRVRTPMVEFCRCPGSHYVESIDRNGKIDPQYAMMDHMTLDATGHGTRDAEHDARPVDRASAPEATTGVPSDYALPERGAGRGTQDTDPQDTADPDPRPVPQDDGAARDGNWLTRAV